MKPTYRKSWTGNLLMWPDLTLSPSFKVKRGQPNIKVLITCLLLILEVCNVKPTGRISWDGNALVLLDLTICPSFKIKRWLSGFGELSFQRTQICISSPTTSVVHLFWQGGNSSLMQRVWICCAWPKWLFSCDAKSSHSVAQSH